MIKDYKGDEIKVGTVVAYNLSGSVRIGVVTRFIEQRPPASWKPQSAEIQILHGKDPNSLANKGITKVKDVRKCAVIAEKVEE